MNIICHTNLDLSPCEKWPDTLPCRPMVGDLITSSTGLELEVCRVVFSQVVTLVARCVVELHLPQSRFENISAFERWYKTRNFY